MKTYTLLTPDFITQSEDAEVDNKKCRVYIRQLRRTFGREPAGSRLSVLVSGLNGPHDVIIKWDSSNDVVSEYLSQVLLDNPPTGWDDKAKEELSRHTPTILV